MSNLAIAEGILFRACAITGIYPEDLRSRKRATMIARTRQAVMYAIRTRVGQDISLPIIAKLVGLNDHTTVVHAMKVMPGRMESDPVLKQFVEKLMAAEPIPPTTLKEALIKAGIARAKISDGPARARQVWSGDAKITWGTLVERPYVPKPAKVVAAPPPPPKEPRFKPHDIAEGVRVFLDNDGREYAEVMGEFDMIAGSRGLALSILTARAAA